jgi:hypothetical protein
MYTKEEIEWINTIKSAKSTTEYDMSELVAASELLKGMN